MYAYISIFIYIYIYLYIHIYIYIQVYDMYMWVRPENPRALCFHKMRSSQKSQSCCNLRHPITNPLSAAEADQLLGCPSGCLFHSMICNLQWIRHAPFFYISFYNESYTPNLPFDVYMQHYFANFRETTVFTIENWYISPKSNID